MQHYKFEKKYQRLLTSFQKTLLILENFLLYLEIFDEKDLIFEQNLESLYKNQDNLKKIYETLSKISFKNRFDYINNGKKIVGIKAHILNKIFNENDNIYVDLNKNISEIFKYDD